MIILLVAYTLFQVVSSRKLFSKKVTEEKRVVSSQVPEKPKYLDGTYIGDGDGFKGVITLSVDVVEGKIHTIRVISHSDDLPWFEEVDPDLMDRVILGQDYEIDGITGATFSSRGVLSGIKDALSKASVK